MTGVYWKGRIILFGGQNASEEQVFDHLFVIDVEKLICHHVQPVSAISPVARNSHGCILFHNFMLVFFGSSAECGPISTCYWIDLMAMNDNSVEWHELMVPSCILPREMFGLTMTSSTNDSCTIKLSGGRGPSGQLLADCWDLVIRKDLFNELQISDCVKSDLQSPICCHLLYYIDGNLVTVGGVSETGLIHDVVVQRADESRTCERCENLARFGHCGTLIRQVDGRALFAVFGGVNIVEDLNDVVAISLNEL